MCEPTVIAAGATAAGGIVQRYQEGERYKEAVAQSTVSTRQNQATLNTRVTEERRATAYRSNALSLEADRVRGQVATSAAAGGVQGPSIEDLGSEVTMDETGGQQALAVSLGAKEGQLFRQQVALGQEHVARSLQYRPTTSYAGAVLSGAGAGASLHFQQQAAETKRT